ncbi:MAG: MarR family transcriptional regulator [Clostridiales bacterium]|nr:MarR family transcriptional regulator [Clostridiales bacterium]
MKNNAKELCDIWNKVLLDNRIQVCGGDIEGLGVTEVNVLKLVYANPDYRIKQYLDILQIPNSTFTNMINRLVKRELLVRKLEENDLRSFKLELTEKGKSAVESHLQAEEEVFLVLLSNLTEEEQGTFVKLFAKLVSE